MEQTQQITLPHFTLYGLVGCPHCYQAETFLRVRNIPAFLIVSNNDPIIIKGVKEVTGQENYPVLWHRPTNEIVIGFNQEVYERLAKNYFDGVSAGASGLFSGVQQPSTEAQVPAPQVTQPA